MARIAGVDLPRNKRACISLTYIYGIGRTRALELCGKAGVDPDTRTDLLGEGEVVRLREIIERESGWKAICGARCRRMSNC